MYMLFYVILLSWELIRIITVGSSGLWGVSIFGVLGFIFALHICVVFNNLLHLEIVATVIKNHDRFSVARYPISYEFTILGLKNIWDFFSGSIPLPMMSLSMDISLIIRTLRYMT